MISYKHLRNIAVNTVRREKAAYLTRVNEDRSPNKLWKALQSLGYGGRSHHLQKPDDINNYFRSVFSSRNSQPAATHHYSSTKFNDSYQFSFVLPTIEEVTNI